MLIIFGEEYRGSAVADLVEWGLGRDDVRFAYLGDYATRAALPTWACFPICCPVMCSLGAAGEIAQEYAGMPTTLGKTQPALFTAAANGSLECVGQVVGANPLSDGSSRSKQTEEHVRRGAQDIFLTVLAAIADVVFPAASLCEKTGTVTNTFGDLQLARKAVIVPEGNRTSRSLPASRAVWGRDVKALVPFGKSRRDR